MTVTSPHFLRRLLAGGLAVPILAGCSTGGVATPTPTSSPSPTLPPPVPSYSLGPSPSGCPTAAPAAMATDQSATVALHTNFGDITVKVDGKLGPNAAGDFVALARCGYYNNVIFHRLVAKFIIQAGDGTNARLPDSLNPAKMGQGGPGFAIKDDTVTEKYVRGTIAMARTSTADSGGSQFFIVLDDSAQTALGASGANNYAIFGNVTAGLDVVDKIAAIPTAGEVANGETTPSTPTQPAVITSVTVTQP